MLLNFQGRLAHREQVELQIDLDDVSEVKAFFKPALLVDIFEMLSVVVPHSPPEKLFVSFSFQFYQFIFC